MVGNTSKNELLSIKRVVIKPKPQRLSMEFTAPAMGSHKLSLLLFCDSYLGADQEYEISLKVKEKRAEKDGNDVDMEEEPDK